MADRISPDPGFAFQPGTEQTGSVWITELIRLVERNASTTLPGRNTQAAAVADLNQTISATPTQAEVQAISDKVDELLAALRAATGLLET